MSDFVSYVMLLGALGTGGDMPYWATTNQYGIMPESSGGLMTAYVGMPYDSSKDFQWHWAASLAYRADKSNYYQLMPDEAYAGIKWKPLSLDIGFKHHDQKFLASDAALGSLSTTSGYFMWSGNVRSLPGYTLALHPWKVPGTKGILEFEGRFGDYITYDNRYVRNAMIHNEALSVTLNLWRFSLSAGIDHCAQWAGVSPKYGRMPCSFKTYIKMCMGQAEDGGSPNDGAYVVGNQLGAEVFRLMYHHGTWDIAAQFDHPYDDKSGMRFENFPDGVYTLSFSFNDKDRWVSDVVYEFAYTMNQSGPSHRDDKGEVVNGADNYFNNEDYKSGWTYFGRTIGLPLITPMGTGNDTWSRNGITYGVENNRVIAHHIGLSGKICRKVPYRLMLTYSQNYGKFWNHGGGGDPSCEWPGLKQFSGAFTAIIPFLENKLQLIPGIYLDAGEYRRNCFGATVGLKYIIK